MSETTETTKGTPLEKGQSSEGEKGSTSKQTPKTFTESENQKAISDALAKQGREHKKEITAISAERDTLKSQLESKTSEIEEITAEREKLNTHIDELSSDDPQKFNLVKKERDLADREKKLKTQAKGDEERIKKAENFEREALIQELIEEYENSDFDKLNTYCQKHSIKSEEDIRDAADTFWTKKGTESEKPETPPMKPYSGKTDGGTDNLGSMSPKERVKESDRRLREK